MSTFPETLSESRFRRLVQEEAARVSAPASRPFVFAALAPHASGNVDARGCVERGTAFAFGISAVLCVLGIVFLVFTLTGALIVGALMLAQVLTTRRAQTILRASALRVGPRQFPEIHACAAAFAKRLRLDHEPEIYVVDAAEVNGFALRFGRRAGIVLTDETVAACLEGKSPGALAFVLAHELGHIALGHHRWWRTPLRRLRWLSRLDELSADNVACELVATSEAAESGVLLLVAGPRLLSFVDRDAARAQAAEIAKDRPTRRAERILTHPVALRRLDRVVKRFGTAAQARAAA